jgi:hypothetical protein
MSHHLDSPLAQKDPRLDISDVYLFPGNSGTVFVIDVNPQSGKGGFHNEAMYEFNIDTDGDAVADLVFRATFGEYQDGAQTIIVQRLSGADASDRTAQGAVIAKGTTGATLEGEDGIRVYAGAAAEPFYIEGRVVTAVKKAVAEGGKLELGDFDPKTAANLFGNSNVCALVLEVPNELLGEAIGFWGTVALATDAGGWRQVQRAATPLVNTLYDFTEIHLNGGEEHANYNATNPAEDIDNYGSFVTGKTAAVVAVMGTADDPEAYAKSLVSQLFPDVLRYKPGTPVQFSLRERNGRDLTCDTSEVMFEWVLGTPVRMGLDASAASGQLRGEFPYVSVPIKH